MDWEGKAMATRKASGETAAPTPDFERALQRLEQIVKEMEGGELPLDAMIHRFEEGQSLIGVCNKKLNEVERRIEMLVKKDGETKAVPFDADEDADDGEEPVPEKSGDGTVPF